MATNGVLLFLNTFHSFLLPPLLLHLVLPAQWPAPTSVRSPSPLSFPPLSSAASPLPALGVLCWLQAFRGVAGLGSMLAASIHRRHLMVWGLFAPKVFYEIFIGAATGMGILASAAIAVLGV